MNIILATNNQNKLKEMRALLSDVCENVYSLKDKNLVVDVEENGLTFEENALIKAREVSMLSGLVAVADDSGLCVDALNGAPSVFSARFAGEPSNDENNNKKLIEELQNLEKIAPIKKSARFVSCIAAVFPDGRSFTESATLEGEITYERKGSNGFGYDPYFYIPECGKTMAELEFEEKNKISHRAKAFLKFKKTLEKYIND